MINKRNVIFCTTIKYEKYYERSKKYILQYL